MKLIILQILSVPLVIFVFSRLETKYAGLIASTIFLSIALYSIIVAYSYFKNRSISLYIWSLFLILAAIPMLTLRIYYWDLNSSEIFIGNISFDMLHKIGEKIYALGWLGSLVDYIRHKKAA